MPACDRPCCRGNQDEILIVRDMADYRATLRLYPNLEHTRWAFVIRPEKYTGWLPDHVIVTETATEHPFYHSYPNGAYYWVNKVIAYGGRYTCLVS